MNNISRGFLVSVALVGGGIAVGIALSHADLAAAAPRNPVITKDGANAKVRQYVVTLLDLSDGGTQYSIAPVGEFTESTTLADAGVQVTLKQKSKDACLIPTGGADETAANRLATQSGLVCFRTQEQMER